MEKAEKGPALGLELELELEMGLPEEMWASGL